jgi:hypothetical protein
MADAKNLQPVIKGDLLSDDPTILADIKTKLGDTWGYDVTAGQITLYKIA